MRRVNHPERYFAYFAIASGYSAQEATLPYFANMHIVHENNMHKDIINHKIAFKLTITFLSKKGFSIPHIEIWVSWNAEWM